MRAHSLLGDPTMLFLRAGMLRHSGNEIISLSHINDLIVVE